MKSIKIISFALVPVLLLILLFAFSFYKSSNSDVESAKLLLKNVDKVRIAIDKYYLESGEFPDLYSEEKRNDLSLIKFKNKDGKEKTFEDILEEDKFPTTPEYKNLEETNKVNRVDDFKKPTNNGGWNYNIETGEIRVNIPNNYFNQSIEWNSY